LAAANGRTIDAIERVSTQTATPVTVTAAEDPAWNKIPILEIRAQRSISWFGGTPLTNDDERHRDWQSVTVMRRPSINWRRHAAAAELGDPAQTWCPRSDWPINVRTGSNFAAHGDSLRLAQRTRGPYDGVMKCSRSLSVITVVRPK